MKLLNIPGISNLISPRHLAWLDARSTRERLILFLAAVVFIYTFWNMLLYKPIKASIYKRRNDIVQVSEKTKKIDQEIAEVIELVEEGSDDISDDLTTRAQLLERAKVLDEKLGILTSDLISSSQMVTALRAMLERQQGLHLLSLDTAPAKQLETDDELEDSNDLAASLPGIYKHEITIVLLGDYFSVLNYLRALESLGWRLFWDSMEYKVLMYPTAQITIKLHTLSSQKGFISG